LGVGLFYKKHQFTFDYQTEQKILRTREIFGRAVFGIAVLLEKDQAMTIPEKIAQSLVSEELLQEEVRQFISTLKKLVLILDEKVK
jgi:hypothetical protein